MPDEYSHSYVKVGGARVAPDLARSTVQLDRLQRQSQAHSKHLKYLWGAISSIGVALIIEILLHVFKGF